MIPQERVTLAPGSRVIRSSPVTNALGGQVIGSIAIAVRRRAGGSGSPVNTCSQE